MELVLAGLAVGILYGLFGVGSALATPVLSLLGVPALAAVVAPLPALVPSAMTGAWSYARSGKVDRPLARRMIAGALPATVLGAATAHWVAGRALLVLSGLVLVAIGVRVVLPGTAVDAPRAARHRASGWFVPSAAAGIGLASGLLANGGGFLLVPFFLLALGLDMNRATGTSLVVATALALPTLTTHLLLGNIDWSVSTIFALGLVPGTALGSRLAQRLSTRTLRLAFGVLLMTFATWYTLRQLGLAVV